MATMAVIAGAGALVGGLGSYFGAKSANKPKKFSQTTTPFMSEHLTPYAGSWLGSQDALVKEAMGMNPWQGTMTNPWDGSVSQVANVPGVGGAGGGASGGGPRARRRAARQAGGGGGTAAGGNAGPGGVKGQFQDIYQQGQDWSDPTLGQGRDYLERALGATNFDGMNDYASGLANEVSGASFQDPINRYEQFMQQDGRVVDPGGRMVDTMAQGGWVADQAKWFTDDARLDPENDPTLRPYLDAMADQNSRQFARERGSLSAALEGRGRGSGDTAIAEDLLARADNRRQMDLLNRETYMGARKDALGQRMSAVEMMSGRDLAAMADQTDRYGINTQADVAYRGQNLEAIRGIQDQQQFGLGLQQALGQQLTDQQLAAAGMAPDYATAGLEGLKLSLGATSAQADFNAQMASVAAQRSAASQAANAQRYATNLGHQEWMAGFRQDTLNNAIRNMGIVGGMGGHTEGVGASPGINTGAAFLQGAAGGGMAALGTYGSGREAGLW